MQLPYPDIPRLRELLDADDVRHGLPVNVRAPMAIAAEPADLAPAFIARGEYSTTPQREGLPDLGSYTSVGNPNMGTYRSQPLQTGFPFVFIGLAGYLPDPRLSLKLACASESDCKPDLVAPAEYARESWHDLVVRVPASRFRIVADDHSPDLWFAFSAPLEAGWLSVIAAAIIGHLRADPLLWLGLACAAGVLFVLQSLRFDLAPHAPTES